MPGIRCDECGAEMVRTHRSVTRTWKGRKVTFQDVEALACPNCGEVLYDPEVVRVMELLSETGIGVRESNPVMNVRELAEFLKVSTQTIYNMLREGRLAARKVGREWRFHREDIERLLRVESVSGPRPAFGVAFRSRSISDEDRKKIHEEIAAFERSRTPEEGEPS